MGLRRIIAEQDFQRVLAIVRGCLGGWHEKDVRSVIQKLGEPRSCGGGMLKLTAREYRALREFNRRLGKAQTVTSPILVWVQKRGLFWAMGKH